MLGGPPWPIDVQDAASSEVGEHVLKKVMRSFRASFEPRLGMTVWTVVAFARDFRYLGMVQRGLIFVYWNSIVAVGIHLVVSQA